MIRVKLIGIPLALFGALGIFVYSDVSDRVETVAVAEVDTNLDRARRFVALRRALLDHAILERAEVIAQTPKIAELLAKKFSPPPPADPDAPDAVPSGEVDTPVAFAYKVHQAMWEEMTAWEAQLKVDKGNVKDDASLKHRVTGSPYLLAVVDTKGMGVAEARDAAKYGNAASYGKEYPSIMRALKTGVAVKDVWRFRGNPVVVAITPVVDSADKVLGAVLLGYNLTVAAARRAQQLAHAHVAYLVGGKMEGSSSLRAADERAFGKTLKDRVGRSKAGRGIYDIRLGPEGDKYKASWMLLTGYATGKPAIAVLHNMSKTAKNSKSDLLLIPIVFFGVVFLVVIAIGFVFSRYDSEFRSLDKGVLEIINGGLDYWFEVPGTGVASMMAQNLNIMVCQLSGRPLPEDDDQVQAKHWVRDQIFVDSIDPNELASQPVASSVMDTGQLASLSDDMIRLVKDSDDEYRRRTFKEYVEALRKTGQPFHGITYEAFSEQLSEHALKLSAQLGCARVRFLVEIENRKATLKPVPLD